MVARAGMPLQFRLTVGQDRGVRRLLVVLAALVLSGCGLRIDAPDPTPSPPSADEVVRQREALRSQALAEVEGEEAVARVAGHAAQQLDALGGVWVAWPAGDGPTPTADPTPDIVVAPGAAGVLASLDATIPDLVSASQDADDAGLARLLAAVATARTADAEVLAAALGAARDLPPLPATLESTDAEVVRSLDAAAWLLESIAARTRASGGDAGPLVERAEALRELGHTTVAANGWLGTAADPRDPWYPASDDDVATIEADLARVLVAAIGERDGREGLLAAARNCAALAARGGADLGALPGLG